MGRTVVSRLIHGCVCVCVSESTLARGSQTGCPSCICVVLVALCNMCMAVYSWHDLTQTGKTSAFSYEVIEFPEASADVQTPGFTLCPLISILPVLLWISMSSYFSPPCFLTEYCYTVSWISTDFGSTCRKTYEQIYRQKHVTVDNDSVCFKTHL